MDVTLLEQKQGQNGKKSISQMLLYTILPLVVGIGGILVVQGCSSAPEPDPPTTSEIRGDSDRFFQKMQKEEDANKSK